MTLLLGRRNPAKSMHGWHQVRPNRSALTIGELLLAPGVAAALDAGGFNRHTFMCGQSGSGKTYSLGLVLEQLLVGTSLRMVILDPNSDYVRLSEVRDSADPAVAAEYAAAASGVSVWQNDPGAAHPLQLQFIDIDPAAQAAVFGLDPIRDREEYAALSGILAGSEKGRAVISDPEALLSSDNPDTRQLGLRAANLGVLRLVYLESAAAEGHWSTSWRSRLHAAWSSTWVRSTPSMSSDSSPKPCCRRSGATGRAASHA